MLMPGAGMYAPARYSASIAAVKASFFRISATLNAFRNVLSTGLLLDQLTGAARGLDLLAGRLREGVGVHGERLRDLTLAEDLDRDLAARGEVLLAQGIGGHLRPLVEACLEVPQVHRLGLRAELLERHRLLHVRAAQLAHPHVDRGLAALEVDLLLRARARAGALVAAAGGLAHARALAPAHALARPARARGGLQGVEPDALSHRPSPDGRPHGPVHERWGGPPARRNDRSSRDPMSSASRSASGWRRRRTSPG